jgi:hypothetical protein
MLGMLPSKSFFSIIMPGYPRRLVKATRRFESSLKGMRSRMKQKTLERRMYERIRKKNGPKVVPLEAYRQIRKMWDERSD